MKDILLRCETRGAWIAWAIDHGVIDPDGGPMTGYDVDEVGNFEITPPIYADDFVGTLISPGEYDTWWRVNVRLTGAAADIVIGGGRPIILPGDIPAREFGVEPNRIQVIEGAGLELRQIWSGGMVF